MKAQPFLLDCLLLARWLLPCVGLTAAIPPSAAANPPLEFVTRHCLDCHTGAAAEAGLDLEQLSLRLDGENIQDEQDFKRWVQVIDRVALGEMPPRDQLEPIDAEELQGFSSAANTWLHEHSAQEQQRLGRVRGRRLTNLQLERTLHDLLGIDIPLEREMPEEPKTESFSTLAERQPISHFHLEQHLKVVDLALDEAFRRALTPEDGQLWEMSAKKISRVRTRTREPEFIDGKAVVWSSNLAFYGRMPATSAPHSGWYRFEFEVSGINLPQTHGVCCSIRSGECVSGAPLMDWIGSFEATQEPQVISVEAWLPKGHMLEVRPADATLKQARFQGGQSANGEGGSQHVPGINIHWLNMQRVHQGLEDKQIRQLLFNELPVELARGSSLDAAWTQARVQPAEPRQAARQLIENFAERAFRRPATSDGEVDALQEWLAVFDQALQAGASFPQALRTSYRAILCSARFLYFQEPTGELDDYAIASRLSYMLWNSMPDETLFQLAQAGKLREPGVLIEQLTRMLHMNRGQQFVRDFADEWLELSEIDFTSPDRRTHPDFDVIVQEAMLAETYHFLQDMLDENLSVRGLIDSDSTFANGRLARFYGLDFYDRVEANTHAIQRVPVQAGTHRGGLLAQGAILKVTANGTHTSPVLRGVWVARRLLGVDIPPPPANVPAIEPDIRGAKTIREQLAKHRSQSECASCHSKIDPLGFALENFDAAGKWRDVYSTQPSGRGPRPRIDASYVMPDGREFDSFESFRRLVAEDPKPIARNLVRQLLTYGTGAEIEFADRPEIEAIVDRLASQDYGLRAILDAVVNSQIFLSK